MKKIKAIIEKANDGGISIYSASGLRNRKPKKIFYLYWKNRLNTTTTNTENILPGIVQVITWSMCMTLAVSSRRFRS